jgi:uncharacterized membrane protein (DUF2068 family)
MAATSSFDSRPQGHSSTPADTASPARHPGQGKGHLLRIIAVFKFFKSASLIALSVGVFRMMHRDLGGQLEHWVEALRLDPGNRYVEAFLVRASNLDPTQVKKLGLVGLLYAGLFLVEGTGLWLQRRWGEWATVVITGLLIPVEAYEIHRHPSAVKIGVLVLNVAVVVYLIYRIRTEKGTPN